MERFLIRNVSPRDIPAIALLERSCFPGEPWSEKLLTDAAAHPDTVFFVAEAVSSADAEGVRETHLAGYCVLRTILGEGSIDNICVSPAFRRKHLAHTLLHEAMRASSEEHGADSFILEVRESNAKARALYESLGFVNEGVRRGYYTHPREDALLYRLRGKSDTQV